MIFSILSLLGVGVVHRIVYKNSAGFVPMLLLVSLFGGSFIFTKYDSDFLMLGKILAGVFMFIFFMNVTAALFSGNKN